MTASILLIDDDSLFVSTLKRTLERRDFTVFTAATLADALTVYTTHRPDKIVLDLNLAGESGLQLLSRFIDSDPTCQVVMLTAYASVVTAVEAIKRGALNYLCKPVGVNEILAAFNEESHFDAADDIMEPVSVDRLEWEHIQRVLLEYDGNISATARALNMHRRTLQRKLQKRPSMR